MGTYLNITDRARKLRLQKAKLRDQIAVTPDHNLPELHRLAKIEQRLREGKPFPEYGDCIRETELIIERLVTTEARWRLPLLGDNFKITKNLKRGLNSKGLSAAPHLESKYWVDPITRSLTRIVLFGTWTGVNACPWASPGCVGGCLRNAGCNRFFWNSFKRRAITILRRHDPDTFYKGLYREIDNHIWNTDRAKQWEGFDPSVRLAIVDDNIGDNTEVFRDFEGTSLIGIDYTKKLMTREEYDGRPNNYTICFSLSETNLDRWLPIIREGRMGSVVFDIEKTDPLPTSFYGVPVVNGIVDDALNYQDIPEGGVVRGLALLGNNEAKASARQTHKKTGLSFAVNLNRQSLRIVA